MKIPAFSTQANAPLATFFSVVLFCASIVSAQQKPFPVISTIDAPTIAGHPVQLDAQGKLMPWPMPNNTG
jgi:hypothetical protein